MNLSGCFDFCVFLSINNISFQSFYPRHRWILVTKLLFIFFVFYFYIILFYFLILIREVLIEIFLHPAARTADSATNRSLIWISGRPIYRTNMLLVATASTTTFICGFKFIYMYKNKCFWVLFMLFRFTLDKCSKPFIMETFDSFF